MTKWDVYKCPVTALAFDPFKVTALLRYYSQDKLNDLIAKQEDPATAVKLAAVARKAFGLSSVDPATAEGYPDAAVLLVLEKFSEYVQGKGSGAGNWRNYVGSASSQPSSAPKNCSHCP